jgi:Fic family protein
VEREYLTSHPWLTFELGRELTAVPELWTLLGEAQSKCEQLASVLVEPGVAEKLHLLYLAKGAAATTQIEGSPLTEEQALAVVEGRHDLNADADFERQTLNIVEACNQFLEELEHGRRPPVTPARIKLLNQLVLEGTLLDDGTIPGEISRDPVIVRIFNYRGAPRADCDHLLVRLCDFLNSEDFAMPENLQMARAILRAIVGHVYIALIHPFGDGNGRTARLLEVQILLASGVPAPACHLLSNHYNETRATYYRELDRVSKGGGKLVDFLRYALRGLVSQLADQIAVVGEYQRRVIWRDHIFRTFGDRAGKPARRQRELILTLSELVADGPLVASRLQTYPEVRALYAALDPKTLARDLNELKKLGLIVTPQAGHVVLNHDVLKRLQVRRYPVRPVLPGEPE